MADKIASILEINVFFKELAEFLGHSKDLFEKGKENISTQALIKFNKLNENNFLLNLIKNIDEIGDDLTDANDAFFNYLNSHNLNLHITHFYNTINLVEEFLKANITFSDKSSLKNHLIKIIDSFNESKKSLNEFNGSIEDLIKNISNSQEKGSEIKDFLNTIKTEIEKSNNEVKKIIIKSEEIVKIPIFNKEYFEKRNEELKLLQEIPLITFYTNIVAIIKSLSVKDENGNEFINNYAYAITKGLELSQFKAQIEPLMNQLKEYKPPFFKILEGDQLEKEESYFKAKSSSFKINDYKYKINELNKNISNMNFKFDDMNMLNNLSKLQKELLLLNKIKTNEKFIGETIILNDWSDTTNTNNKYPDFSDDFSNKLIPLIEKVSKYKLIDKSLLKPKEVEKTSEEILENLAKYNKISDYIKTDLTDKYYEKAQDEIKDQIKNFEEGIKIIMKNKKDNMDERLKKAKELKDIINHINKFNKYFFMEMKEYLKISTKDNIKCILANEMSKVSYFSLLLKNMNLLKNDEIKARAKELDAKIGGIKKKEDAMKKIIDDFKEFITEKTLISKGVSTDYIFFDIDALEKAGDEEMKNFIKKKDDNDKKFNQKDNILLNAISATQNYLTNLNKMKTYLETMTIEKLD